MELFEEWIEVGGVDDLAPGQGRSVEVAGLQIALFNDGGEYLAVDDTCPHHGASLGEGSFHEGRVICPLHAWVFDLRTGRCPRESHEPVETYKTRCIDGTVQVRIGRSHAGQARS